MYERRASIIISPLGLMICHVYNAIDAGGAHMCSGLCTLKVGYVCRGGWGGGEGGANM